MVKDLKTELLGQFKDFKQVELVNDIVSEAISYSYAEETVLIEYGAFIKYIPFVIEGVVRVYRTDQQLNEVLLYYIKPGESCAITLMSAFQKKDSRIRAIVDANSKIIFCPSYKLTNFYSKYPTWQSFVVNTFDQRFGEVLDLVDNVCFRNLDQRLANYLINKYELSNSLKLKISHAVIAHDLNSSREVISRLLKKLVERGIISVNRGEINILDMGDLRHLI